MNAGPYDVILLWRRDRTNQPWSLNQILYQGADGTVNVHEASAAQFYPNGPAGDFAYLWERHLDGSGGNGYSYEIEGFTLPDLTELEALLEERTQEPDFFTDPSQRGVNESPDLAVSAPALVPRPSDDPELVRAAVPPWEPLPSRRRLHRRTGPPLWLQRTTEHERSELTRGWGEDFNWGWGLPWLWAALSNRHTILRPPATPTQHSTDYEAGAYWTPALHLMLYGLGWQRPDQGLVSWLLQGRPHANPALTLLDEVWVRDRQLEWLLAWLARGTLTGPALSPTPSTGTTTLDWHEYEPWIMGVQRQAESTHIPSPISASSDALHLSAHCHGPEESPEPGGTRVVDGPRPVLIADDGRGWYRSLCEQPDSAPPIDVMSRSLGFVGTFGRDPSTGRAHLAQVSPNWHAAGN